jgi:spermidine synthase
MIISLALLGYGASGTFLTLLKNRLEGRFVGFFVVNTLLFACTAVAAFLLAQQLPFNPLEILRNTRQWGYLLSLYLMLAVPFFCMANGIGAAFLTYGHHITRIYAFDLVGAGTGALIIILVLFVLKPITALFLLGIVGLAAALVALWEMNWRPFWAIAGIVLIGLMGSNLPKDWTQLRLSVYKDLSQALRIVGAKTLAERSSPLGHVTVVANGQVPFRYAPGLSLNATAMPPSQLGLFSDGNALGAITRFDGDWTELAYLDYLTSALPYHLLDLHPRVAVLGAGGGMDVLQALYHKAQRIDAVELNPQVVQLVNDHFAAFSGGLFDRPEVQVHISEARGFLAASQVRYDLIQVALLDAFSTTSAGLYALSESYLYTVEALQTYLQHLTPDGVLAITRWLQMPPRDSLKLFATAVQALKGLGVSDPGSRLALIRGWKTTTLVVKNGSFNSTEVAALQTFSKKRSFDTAWYPGIQAAETNQFNVLDQPYLYQGAQAILGPQREKFLQSYKFNIVPASDDRPYFFRFLKWQTLPEFFGMRAASGLGQMEWGYLVLVATLLKALLTAGLLILLPLWLVKHMTRQVNVSQRWRVFVYFTAIGLGFLFLEIAFIQKFVLFLSHPLYAVAVVLCAFLIFAGLGSGYVRHLAEGKVALAASIAGIALLGVGYLIGLPALFSLTLAWPDILKICLAIALVAPLAFCMGMPFPLGLTWVATSASDLVPWAWAINGCASVISAVLATLLAVHMGFNGVVGIAITLYLLALLAAPYPDQQSSHASVAQEKA